MSRKKKEVVVTTFRCPECGNEISTELVAIAEIDCSQKFKHKRRRMVPMQKVESQGG